MTIKIVSAIALFSLVAFQSPAAESMAGTLAHYSAVESCTELTNKSVSDLGVWAEYQGLSQAKWRQIVATMCLNGITTARKARSENAFNDYWHGMKQKYSKSNVGVLSTPLDSAWSISRKYFNALHPEMVKQEMYKTREAAEKQAEINAEINFTDLPQDE